MIVVDELYNLPVAFFKVILMAHLPGFDITTFQTGFFDVPKLPALQTVLGELDNLEITSPLTVGFRGTVTGLKPVFPALGNT